MTIETEGAGKGDAVRPFNTKRWDDGFDRIRKPCPDCDATGRIILQNGTRGITAEDCGKCGGSGLVPLGVA